MLAGSEAMAQDAKAKGPTSIQDIPAHLFNSHILLRLPAKDLCRVSATSHRWRLHTINDIREHWRQLYTNRWPAKHAWNVETAVTWQSRFSSKMWEVKAFSGKVGTQLLPGSCCASHRGM